MNTWKDAVSKQLMSELEEVKETSGIELQEQESTIQLEELTDMQAFDQSPKLEGMPKGFNKDSQKMIIVSQEKGFKSFLENQQTSSNKSPTQIMTHSQSLGQMVITRKKYNLSELPNMVIAPANFNLNPSEVSFSDKIDQVAIGDGVVSSHHQKTLSMMTYNHQSLSPSPEFKRTTFTTSHSRQPSSKPLEQPKGIINKLKSIV